MMYDIKSKTSSENPVYVAVVTTCNL